MEQILILTTWGAGAWVCRSLCQSLDWPGTTGLGLARKNRDQGRRLEPSGMDLSI